MFTKRNKAAVFAKRLQLLSLRAIKRLILYLLEYTLILHNSLHSREIPAKNKKNIHATHCQFGDMFHNFKKSVRMKNSKYFSNKSCKKGNENLIIYIKTIHFCYKKQIKISVR